MNQMQLFPLGGYDQNTQFVQQQPMSQPVNVDFSQFNVDHFFNMIQHIDTLTEPEIIMLIRNHIDVLVNRIFENDPTMGPILRNPKFVDAYCKAMTLIPLNHERKIFCNKITYEYTFAKNRDDAILEKFRGVSDYVNQNYIQQLTNLGIAKRIASNMALCRYSSTKESINVKRLNFTMCMYNEEFMTEQMCVWIYEIFFDNISELFISSMLEIYSDADLDSNGPDFRDIYGNISLAILTILNNMTLGQIRTVIEKYIERFMVWYTETKELPRFTLTCLSNDYARIVQVVDTLTAEGVYVP